VKIFEQVKNLVSLEQVAEYYGLEFNKNDKALCPFHDDTNPSFSLHPSKQFAKCFSCDVAVDAIELEYRLGKHSTKFEAAKALNNRYSLNIKMHENNNQTKEFEDVSKLLKYYCDRTHKHLLQNKQALEWLEINKGITLEDSKRYNVGYTSRGWLASSIKPENKELAVKVGLLNEKDSNYYDCFRNRIVFPILINGRIEGIWTRRFPDNEDNGPKWFGLKSSEYIPHKSIAFRENLNCDKCIVCEGIPDSIAFLKTGYRSVSLLGSGISQENRKYFEKAKARLYFALDPDEAGKSASYKLAKEFKGSVIDLGFRQDPDEILVQIGLDKFKQLIIKSIDTAKSYESILEEERLFSSSGKIKTLHPSMDYLDDNLIFGFRDRGNPFFLYNHALYSFSDIEKKYNLLNKPNSNGFSKNGIKKYLDKTPVNIKSIIERIVNLLNRYLVFQYYWQPHIIAYWIAGTYLYRCFPLYPYLWIQSPTKRCGKTLLLELLSSLAFNCDGIQTAPTEAILFRDPEISGGTLCWDEVENLSKSKEKGERIEIINAAYRKGAKIKRCEGKDNNVKSFEVYRPIILSGIQELPDTVIDRSLKIELIRKPLSDNVDRLQIDKIKPDLQNIKDDLYIFALNRTPKILEAYESFNESIIPNGVDDRLRDGLEIIYSVASAFYTDDTAAFKEIIKVLNEASVALSSIRNDEEEDISFARAILLLKEKSDTLDFDLILSSKEAVDLFQDGGIDWVQETKHARSLLRKLGFRSGSHREKGAVVRGYKIEKSRLNKLHSRYCSSIPPEKTVTCVTSQ